MRPSALFFLSLWACIVFLSSIIPTNAQEATNDNDYEQYLQQQPEEPTILDQTRRWWIRNKPWGRDLAELKAELHAKESILQQMDAYVDNLRNNARPRCPNGTVTITVEEGPREALVADIESLREQISAMEE